MNWRTVALPGASVFRAFDARSVIPGGRLARSSNWCPDEQYFLERIGILSLKMKCGQNNFNWKLKFQCHSSVDPSVYTILVARVWITPMLFSIYSVEIYAWQLLLECVLTEPKWSQYLKHSIHTCSFQLFYSRTSRLVKILLYALRL